MEKSMKCDEKRASLRQDALAAWNHYQATGLHATGEEADAWLVELEAGKKANAPKLDRTL
jgi:predicted transcriptional regulator